MSSRLFQEIREKMGLCYYIAASHHADDTDGLFIIRAGLEKQRWTKGLKAIYAQIAKLVDGEIIQTELDNALGNVKGKTQMGIESSDQLAHFVGMQQLFRGEVHSLEEILSFYETVTLDQLHHVAQRLADDKLYAYRIE
jgi:predicted Zn-dependent peptidase